MRKHAATGLALLLGLFSSLSLAAPGEYWEISNKMEMQGMSMPGRTSKVCMPTGGEKDPRNSADKDCQMSDMKSSGNKSSWKMRCDRNGEIMTGSGEMTSLPDRTEGSFTFNTAKTGSMTINFINKRIGGACDTDEMKRKVEAQVAAGNKELAKMCEGASTSHEWLTKAPMILGKDAVCGGKKAQFCELMKRDAGRDVEVYFSIKNPESAVAQSCGISMDQAKKSICKSVDANNADFNKQMHGNMRSQYSQWLRAECPGEMKVYAEASRKRFCEGRGFTEKQRQSVADCLKGGSGDDQAMSQPDPDEPPMPASPSRNAKKSAAQAGKTEPAPAEPSQDGGIGGIKLPGGLSMPNMPNLPSMPGNADAVMDGAKKLKNLLGF